MKPIRDRQIFPQLFMRKYLPIVMVCSVVVSEGFRFFPSSPFVFHVSPSTVWFHRKWWPGRLCFASSCDWLLVLSTDGDPCCKWRGTFSKYLCIFFEVPLCHDGQWTDLHIVRFMGGDGLPSRRHVLPSEAVF